MNHENVTSAVQFCSLLIIALDELA